MFHEFSRAAPDTLRTRVHRRDTRAPIAIPRVAVHVFSDWFKMLVIDF